MKTGVRLGRALAAVAVAGLALVAGAARADAHAELLSTEPASGAQLATAPTEVVLHFSEAVDLGDDSIRVLDTSGDSVGTGRPEHPDGERSSASLALADLDDGAYVVAWKAVSSDGHPVSGAFTFRVGAATAAPGDDAALIDDVLGGTSGGDHVLGAIYGVARFVAFAGLILVVGGFVFVTWIWPAGRDDRRARRLLMAGWWAAVVATAACIPLQAAYSIGGSLGDALDPGVVADEFGVRNGRAWLVRLVLLGVVALLARARRLDRWAAVGLGLALLVTISLTGHASAGDLVPLAFVVDIAHLSAASVWLGGLTILAGAVLARGGADGGERVVNSFSQVAFGCVLVLVISGTIQALRQVGGYDALFDTAYGRLLVIKVLLVCGMVIGAAVSRAWLRDRAAARSAAVSLSPGPGAVAASPNPSPATLSVLRWSVGAEVALGVAVLAVTALLVNAVPGASDSGPAGPFSTQLHTDSFMVTVDVAPAAVGQNDVLLSVTDHGGAPLADEPEEVTATLRLPAQELGPIPVDLVAEGEGRYRADDTEFPFAGEWDLNVVVRTSEFDQEQLETTVPIP